MTGLIIEIVAARHARQNMKIVRDYFKRNCLNKIQEMYNDPRKRIELIRVLNKFELEIRKNRLKSTTRSSSILRTRSPRSISEELERHMVTNQDSEASTFPNLSSESQKESINLSKNEVDLYEVQINTPKKENRADQVISETDQLQKTQKNFEKSSDSFQTPNKSQLSSDLPEHPQAPLRHSSLHRQPKTSSNKARRLSFSQNPPELNQTAVQMIEKMLQQVGHHKVSDSVPLLTRKVRIPPGNYVIFRVIRIKN